MVIDILKDTLSKVNEWVKFAEAKNAANVAFCSAAVFALSRIILNYEELNSYIIIYLAFVIICLVLSLSISLLSFVPKLDAPWLDIGKTDGSDNFLYFGHACKYSGTDYLELVYGNEKKKNLESYALELAYSNQIVVNSKIAQQFPMKQKMWYN